MGGPQGQRIGVIVPVILKKVSSLIGNPSFWLIVAMMAFCVFLHYGPHVDILKAISPTVQLGLTRNVMVRILFLLPVTYAAFIFGIRGGLITLAVAAVAMVPRIILISEAPLDASLETASVVVVGGLVVLFFQSQQAERKRRMDNERRLAALNAVSQIISGSLELNQVLGGALSKTKEVMAVDVAQIRLVDTLTQELYIAACEGLSPEYTRGVVGVKVGEGLHGKVAETGEPLIVENVSTDPRVTRPAAKREGLQAMLIVPLRAKSGVVGVLSVAMRRPYRFLPNEVELLSAIGNQVGIAIENARLYEQERLVAAQLRVSEKTYRDLFENANEAIWVHDLEGKIVTANPATARLMGYERAELIGKMAQEFLSEHNLGVAREIRRKLLAGEPLEQPYDQRLIKKDGSEAILKMASSLISSDGQPVGFQHVARDVTDEERVKENLRFYVQQATRAQEEERKRIARELHDDTAQGLIALSRQLEKLRLVKDQLPAEGVRLLESLEQQTDAILEGVRRFSQDLRPSILDDLGLLPALESLAEDLTAYGIATDIRIVGEARRLPAETELVLFRIAQEALRNVWRHSHASRAELKVEFSDTKLVMDISDNGRGFELPRRLGDLAGAGKLGLAGMQERARLIDATLTLASEPGVGTTVTVEMPL